MRRYVGQPAAQGLASGALFALEGFQSAPPETESPIGTPGEEGTRLGEAVEAAKSGLARLMADVDAESAAIVEFQLAMLEDDALVEPAVDAIAEGAGAEEGWRRSLDAQIADYRAAEDEYFRARAADLEDLRDRVLRHLTRVDASAVPPGSVLIGSDITPTRFLETDWSNGGGIALSAGSAASHVAMLARARGVPMVVGLGQLDWAESEEALLDGGEGSLVLAPDEAARAAFRERREAEEADREVQATFAAKPALTADGTPVAVLANIADPADLDALPEGLCDGIGLMRSEFLFHGPADLTDEEAQLKAYRAMLAWAAGRPVTVRTLDAGGDKPIDGFTPDGEANPFLGVRGLRLSLTRPDVFKVQLRALARAAAEGDIKVMLPMVTVAAEFEAARRLLDETVAGLEAEKLPCRRPELGIMVEVPAVACAPDLLGAADFFSIGSNDLTQYAMAAARDNPAVSALSDGGHPAVLGLIERTVAYADDAGKPVSLCGDMGGDPAYIEALLRLGLRTVSVAPAAIGRIKAAIAGVDLSKGTG